MNRTTRRRHLVLAVGLGLITAVSATADPRPATVSPGATDGPAALAARCAPFSWTASPDAAGYELEVWGGAQETVAPDELVLREVLEGQVTAWQPSLDRCLDEGSYRWRVRDRARPGAGLGAGGWSPFRRFTVRGGFLAAADGIERPSRWERERIGISGEDSSPELEDTLRRSLVAASLTSSKAGLRAVRTESSGAAVGATGTTTGSGAGVVGANFGNGADVVLGGDAGDSGDQGYLLSDAPGLLQLQSMKGLELRASGLTVRNGATEVFRLDAAGKVTAASFDGDGSGLTGVVASQLACSGCVAANGEIADGSLAGFDLAGLTGADVAGNAIGSAHVSDGQVGGGEFAGGAIGGVDIDDDAVGASEIATGAVGASEIASGAVRSSEISDGAIRAPELGAVFRVKVACNGECDGTGESYRAVCDAVRPGSQPIGVDCSSFREYLAPLLGTFACGGDSQCFEAAYDLGCVDVLGNKDAIVLCLDD